MMYDVHCHLYEYEDPDPGEVVVICNGEDRKSSERCISLAEEYENVYAAVGVHPARAEEDPGWVERYLDRVVALGEVGLDYKYENRERQKEVFRYFLDLAEETGLPLIVHSRRAHGRIVKEIEGRNVKVVLHWWSGNKGLTERAARAGAYFSYGPYIERALDFYREIVVVAGEDRVLTETDGPVNGYRPRDVERALEVIGNILGKEKGSMEKIVERNVKRVFKF